MANRGGGTYSRVIALLKIALPVMALALLSTLFLFSQRPDPQGSLPVADPGLKDRVARQQVTRPYFTGTTDDGTTISLSAALARPDVGDLNKLTAEDVEARIAAKDGASLEIRAPRVDLDQTLDSIRLSGGLTMESNDGYRLTTDALSGRLDPLEAVSDGPVKGNGPAGSFSAGKLRITASGPDQNLQLNFTNGVKLIYDPQPSNE